MPDNANGDVWIVQPGYHTQYAAIVQPEKVFTVSQYFIRYWLPLLNSSLAWLIVALRQRCFWNSQQNWCVVSQERLGQDTGVSKRTVIRQMKAPVSKWFVQSNRRYQYNSRVGRKVHDWNRYTIFQDDPLTPTHLAGLAAILRDTNVASLDQTLQSLADTPGEILIGQLEEAAEGAPQPELARGTPKSVKAVVEYIFGIVESDNTRRLCDTLHCQITNVGAPYLGTQYFRLKWVPILGPTLGWLVVVLRNSCYHNPKTGEQRHECTWRKQDLAAAMGQSTRNVFGNTGQQEHADEFFQEVESGAHWITYRVVMWQDQEPMVPDDLALLEINGFDVDPLTGQLDFCRIVGAQQEPEKVALSKPEKVAPENRKKLHLDNSGEQEPEKSALRDRKKLHLDGDEPEKVAQQGTDQTGKSCTIQKHLLSTSDNTKGQQQQHDDAAAVAAGLSEPEPTIEPPDRLPPEPGGEAREPGDALEPELSGRETREPGDALMPGLPGGEAQAGAWLELLGKAKGKGNRDRAAVLGIMQRRLLDQEPETGRLRRMITRAGGGHAGAERVLYAILEAAQAGGGLDEVEAILLARLDTPPASRPAGPPVGQGGDGSGAGTPGAPAGLDDLQRQAVEALAGLGYDIAEADACELVRRHGADVVLAQIERLPARLRAYEERGEPVGNPAGLLIRSIEGDWPPQVERKRKRGGGRGKRDEGAVAGDRGGASRWRFGEE